MTSPSTLTARSDSLRPQPTTAGAPSRPGRNHPVRSWWWVCTLSAALTGCSAHDYSFACGLIAGFPLGFCFMGWLWAVSRRSV